MNRFIPLSVPSLKGNELKYVKQAVESQWVSTAGAFVNKFEKATAEYCGAKGAVACQSGTAGLHTALIAMYVGAGDEVIVPALTFIAAVNPVRYTGAEPVFMDCDDSLCMDAQKLADFCKNECRYTSGKLYNKQTNRQVKVVIPVHVFGNMADMENIMETARKYGLKVIEDATEAIGTYYTQGRYQGKHAGTIGDVGVYSFNGNKIITTGGGGMIVSDDEILLQHAKHLTTQAKSDELYYTHDEIGYNYRMTNVQAAIGLAQLEQLESFISAKNRNYKIYREYIDKIEHLHLMDFRQDIRCNMWFYALFCDDEYSMNRDGLIQHFAQHNVQTRPIWGLINKQEPYTDCRTYFIERAYHYQNHIVNLPCSTNLKDEDIKYITNML